MRERGKKFFVLSSDPSLSRHAPSLMIGKKTGFSFIPKGDVVLFPVEGDHLCQVGGEGLFCFCLFVLEIKRKEKKEMSFCCCC